MSQRQPRRQQPEALPQTQAQPDAGLQPAARPVPALQLPLEHLPLVMTSLQHLQHSAGLALQSLQAQLQPYGGGEAHQPAGSPEEGGQHA